MHIYIYIYIYTYIYIYIHTYRRIHTRMMYIGGFQGYWSTYTVKGSQFEETKAQI